jgi:O-antigen ligase
MAAIVGLLLAGVLVAAAGTYAWATLPLAIAAAVLFIASGTQVGAQRAIDIALVSVLAIIGVSLIPLPAPLVALLSPAAPALQDLITLQPHGAMRPLSIHPQATRDSLLTAIAAALIFWAARAILARGGVRRLAQVVAAAGFAVAVVALLQHVTAPETLFWVWRPFDPGARPYGPFINRNHFATWLVLAIALTAGVLAVRVQVRIGAKRFSGARGIAIALLSGELVPLVGALAMMLVAVVATLSRSGIVGLIAAGAAGSALAAASSKRRAALTMALVLGALVVLVGLSTNSQGVMDRVETTVSDAGLLSRLTIWRETLAIVRDFPWTGTGAGTFADAMLQYQRTGRQVLFNQAHNEYLQLLAEGGIVLIVALIALGVAFVTAARQASQRDRTPLRIVRTSALAGLIGVGVQSIWETGLRTPACLMLAAVLAALAVRPDAAAEPVDSVQ